MIQKIVILFTLLTLSLIYAQPIKCDGKAYAMLENYIVKRKYFVKYNNCFDSDSIIINTKTNKAVDIEGRVDGIKRLSDILQVNTFAGAHTHIVYFFKIDTDGDLRLIENGAIGSDVGDPIVEIESLGDYNITVKSRYTKDIDSSTKICRLLIEDTYIFKAGVFKRVKRAKELMRDCR